jgi:hypothetical protein
MRYLAVALAGIAAALAVAVPAQAKGALSATITGPGLSTPLRLEPKGHEGLFYAFGAEAKADSLAFGGPLATVQPPQRRGAAYRIVFDFGRGIELRLVAYPFADGGPVVSVPAGQHRPFENAAVESGWFRADLGLPRTMVRLGVPAPPTPSASPWASAAAAAPVPAPPPADRRPIVVGAVAGILALSLLAVCRLRRGRHGTIQPARE